MKKQLAALAGTALCLAALALAWVLLSGGEAGEDGPEDLPELIAGARAVEVAGTSAGYRAAWREGALAVEGLEGFSLDRAAAASLENALTSLPARDTIKDGGERLADFGLEEPAVRVETDGTSLAIGDAVPGAEKRYVLWEGEVYTASQSDLEPFFFRAEDFLSRQITPSDGELERISVSGGGREEPVVLTLADSQELAGYQVRSYMLRSPLEYPADPSRAEAFLASAYGITAEWAEAVRPGAAELAALGLAEPWARLELALRDDGGSLWNAEVSLSEPDASGMAWALAGEVVYRLRTDELYCLGADPGELVSREILAPPVDQLHTLTVERPGGTLVLTLDWDGGGCRVFLGEEELDWDSFRNFYYTLISLRAEEVLFDGLPDPADMEPLASVTFGLEDGERTADYCREADRRVYARAEGRGFRLSYASFSQMLERLDRLAAGETVEARY